MRTCQEGWLVGRSMSAGKRHQCHLPQRAGDPKHFDRLVHSCLQVSMGPLQCAVCGGASLGCSPSPGLRVSVLTSQGHPWGKVTWPQAKQACIRRGRACPFHSGFPGGPRADLPMAWQLRGASIHRLGGNSLPQGGSGGEDRARGSALPRTVKASPGMRCRHGGRGTSL